MTTKEIETRYKALVSGIEEEISSALAVDEPDECIQAYSSLAAINGWRAVLIGKNGADQFFTESQNDLLTSLELARLGAHRAATATIRHSIESFLNFLYYSDHPIELENWNRGMHRLGFSEHLDYLTAHPRAQGVRDWSNWMREARKEYSTLSRAVHGSAKGFLMTSDENLPVVFGPPNQPDRLPKWLDRFIKAVRFMMLVLMIIYRQEIEGTKRRGLRVAMGPLVSESKESLKEIGIIIP